jgi:hypothetical protein
MQHEIHVSWDSKCMLLRPNKIVIWNLYLCNILAQEHPLCIVRMPSYCACKDVEGACYWLSVILAS